MAPGLFEGLRLLLNHPYVRLVDQATGQVRVERGEATVFPRAHEEAAEGGVKAFFTGWQARTFYWAPAIGIFLGLYCSLRKYALDIM